MQRIHIKFILPHTYKFKLEQNKIYKIKISSLILKLKVSQFDKPSYTSYHIYSQPLQDVDQHILKSIEDSLYCSFINYDWGLLMPQQMASLKISEYGKKVLGNNIVSDIIGVNLLDANDSPIEAFANPTVINSLDKFLQDVQKISDQKKVVNERFIRALELYNSTKYLNRINNSGRFILFISSIECLLEEETLQDEIIAVIDNTRREIKSLDIKDQSIIDSITGSLKHLKNKSIGLRGKELVNRLFKNSKKKYNGMSAVDFFKKAYELRSKIVHNGIIEIKSFDIHTAQIHEFTKDCLIKYYEDINQE